jgi:hypothetical protein
MKWLRLHTEARTDRKLDLLTDQQHRIWFNLLCMAGESSERGIVLFESMDLLAIEVARGDIDALTDTLTALERFRMVQNSEGQVAFTHWQERQYDNPSDRPESTRDRKQRSRDNAKISSVSRDVTTSHDTYTDTETDTENKQNRTETDTGAQIAPTPRRKRVQVPADWQPDKDGVTFAQSKGVAEILTEVERFRDFHRAKGNTFLDIPAAWRTWCGNYREYNRSKPNGNGRGPKGPDFAERARQMEAAERAAMEAGR